MIRAVMSSARLMLPVVCKYCLMGSMLELVPLDVSALCPILQSRTVKSPSVRSSWVFLANGTRGEKSRLARRQISCVWHLNEVHVGISPDFVKAVERSGLLVSLWSLMSTRDQNGDLKCLFPAEYWFCDFSAICCRFLLLSVSWYRLSRAWTLCSLSGLGWNWRWFSRFLHGLSTSKSIRKFMDHGVNWEFSYYWIVKFAFLYTGFRILFTVDLWLLGSDM